MILELNRFDSTCSVCPGWDISMMEAMGAKAFSFSLA